MKHILETRNGNNVSTHEWFINFPIKIEKQYSAKTNNMFKRYNKGTKIRQVKPDIRLTM